MKHRELIDRWVPFHNTIVGYIYGSKKWPNGTRVQTDALRFIDPINLEAEDLDTIYKLGTPGTTEEHNKLEKEKKDASDGIVQPDKTLWLNPNG